MNPAVLLKKSVFGTWIFLCLFLVNFAVGRVTPRSSLVPKQLILPEPTKPVPGPEKNYTGIRLKPDSLLLLYYHEQTVAIVEVARNRTLFNCELLEVKTREDQRATLDLLRPVVPTQMKIAFNDMIDLMIQCQELNFPLNLKKEFVSEKHGSERPAELRQLTSIFSGVFPGTKWCGAGDIAASYHDLGPDREPDKCCRTHDLCPVKVIGLRTQHNLTNYAIYTRSHCTCDDHFYNCLKSVGTTVSNLLGGIYFNLTPLVCIEEDDERKKRFVTKQKRY